MDRGFIFAIAHIRGGGEMGRRWYENGKLLKKKNTFTDFITCAEYLIANRYCSKEKLSINGRSAGGLLMGAVLNMRPDLFKAAVAGVPFVDVLTTMLDPTIPLTTSEWEVLFVNDDPPSFLVLIMINLNLICVFACISVGSFLVYVFWCLSHTLCSRLFMYLFVILFSVLCLFSFLAN